MNIRIHEPVPGWKCRRLCTCAAIEHAGQFRNFCPAKMRAKAIGARRAGSTPPPPLSPDENVRGASRSPEHETSGASARACCRCYSAALAK